MTMTTRGKFKAYLMSSANKESEITTVTYVPYSQSRVGPSVVYVELENGAMRCFKVEVPLTDASEKDWADFLSGLANPPSRKKDYAMRIEWIVAELAADSNVKNLKLIVPRAGSPEIDDRGDRE